ncbi:TonB-dependent receptor domain-containing protein [Vibrio penaeicida]|uniref:Vitamin B12 transporter BtuB n=1 Tax=Vibrio penaeicida TaxID=104609 RepID=A0AAV5NSG3_9VIBR|nr:TonB-dependent receptor [Vibrio penaeicida]GLQ73163.1 vitamin B12 transporter BtuB [Vibrio penaeicida]
MKKTLLATTVASLLTHASISVAQEAADTETLVVTANRFEQSVGQVTATVDVITQEQIQNLQIKSLTEALSLLPGVQIAQNGGRGQSSSVFVRGTSSSQIIVLYNGVRIGSATTGSANFTSIPLVGVERIELVKGARAAVYGADAIGGVINIVSSSGADEDSISIQVGAGSDNYRQGAAAVSSKVGDSSWINMSVNTESSDGFDVVGTGPEQPDDDGYSRQDIIFEFGTQLSPVWTAKVMGFHHKGMSEYESYSSSGNLSPDEQETTLYNYAAVLGYAGQKYRSSLSVSMNRDDSNNKGGEFPGSQLITDRQAINWINAYQLTDSVTVQAGVDLTKDSVADSKIWSSNVYKKYDGTSRKNNAVFASAFYQNQGLQLEASLRHDDNEVYGSKSTWQLGAGYLINQSWRLVASGGTAFRAPTYNDLYWPGYGNEDLKPEESLNVEAGVEFFSDLADVRLVGYSNTITNLVSYQSKGEELKNSDATINGIELSSQFTTGELSHSLSLDFLDHNNKVNVAGWGQPEDVQDKKLARRANFAAKWLVSYEYNNWRGDLAYQYQGKRYDDAKNTTELDPYSLVNLTLAYQLTEQWKLRGKVENLFNTQYQTAHKYETQDRAYFVNASYQF